MNVFESYLAKGRRGHLIGIGGVSMSPLAEVLSDAGVIITGSDINESDTVKRLRGRGIEIHIGHSAENLSADTEFVVRTAAAHDDNPEIEHARSLGIPVFERTEAWGAIMKQFENSVCISGTHGKTTTTSMTTHILMAAEKDPTVMIGGTLPLLKAGHRIGRGDTIIMESCEYYDSFLKLFPTLALILNIEADHLDYFRDLEHIKSSFRSFAGLVPENGYVIANADDPNVMSAIKGINKSVLTFGLVEKADVEAKNLRSAGLRSEFDLYCKGEKYARIRLCVPGEHNVKNALAAAAAAYCLGIPASAIEKGLLSFTGAGRRLEFKGSFNGAEVYDDYAHHPGELKALIDAVLTLPYERSILVFQPHTYTRTKALFDDFAEQLGRMENVILAEIYAAREQNTIGISSADLAEAVPGSEYYASFAEIEERLRGLAGPGDIVLTVGAGDVFRIGEHLCEGALLTKQDLSVF